MLGSWAQAGVKLASGQQLGKAPPLSHCPLWLHLATYLYSAAQPDWQQFGLAKAGLSWQDKFVCAGPSTQRPTPVGERGAKRWGPDEAPRTTQERGSHSIVVPTAALRHHIRPWLNTAWKPPWLPSALSTKSSSSVRPWRALVACLLATSPGLPFSPSSLSPSFFHHLRSQNGKNKL